MDNFTKYTQTITLKDIYVVPQAKGKKWVVEVLENEARTLKPGEVGVQSLNNLYLVFWPKHISFNTSDKYYPVKITGE